MADEDKEKAEKVAAARKRFEQLKKQKAKKDKAGKKGKEEEEEKAEATETVTAAPDDAKADTSVEETTNRPSTEESEDISTGDVPIAPSAEGPPAADQGEDSEAKTSAEPTLLEQSRMRSQSFKRGVTSPGPGGNEGITDIYKKQAARIEQLEKENKQLEKDTEDKQKTIDRVEKEIEDLRDAQADVADLKVKAGKLGDMGEETEKLKVEISSLQRQNAQLQSQVKQVRRTSSGVVPTSQTSEDLHAQIAAKTNTIESLELELSNLRYNFATTQSENATLSSRITTSEASLAATQVLLEAAQGEIATLRASDSTSDSAATAAADATRLQLLTRDLAAAQASATDATSRAANLEKKIEALTTLHRESEARIQAATVTRNKELERLRTEASEMRAKVVSMSSANARLRANSISAAQDRPTLDTGDGGNNDAEGADQKLKTRVRELEAEVHDLRRGVWRDRRIEMQGNGMDGDDSYEHGDPMLDDPGMQSPRSVYDEVDLNAASTPTTPAARTRNMPYGAFTSVFSGISNAISSVAEGGQPVGSSSKPLIGGRRQSQARQQGLTGGFFGAMAGMASGVGGDGNANGEIEEEEDEFAFDEEAFRQAQQEEAQKRLERVREVKRGLKEWQGWRVDMVDMRGGQQAGVYDI